MILRNKRISKTADEVMLHVSYGVPDVKRMIQRIFACFHGNCEWVYREELSTPHTELEIIDRLESFPECFGNFQEKWAQQLAEWAINVSIREKFIIQSATHENLFYFSEILIPKKRGRPSKE